MVGFVVLHSRVTGPNMRTDRQTELARRKFKLLNYCVLRNHVIATKSIQKYPQFHDPDHIHTRTQGADIQRRGEENKFLPKKKSH